MMGRRAGVSGWRFLPAIEQGLLLSGIVLLGLYGALVAQSGLYQSRAERAFDRSIRDRDTKPVSPAVFLSRAAVEPRPTALARLRIPSLAFSAMILEGTDELSLLRGVGHIEGTARPGERGNVGLAGHRDTFFRGLSGIVKGDEVVLTTQEGRDLRYNVVAIDIVEPETVDVLAPTGEPSLTLVTCYPFHFVGPAPKRYVVRATLQVDSVVGDAGHPRPSATTLP